MYVDGSEVRGSANATVVISYGNLAALASFTVWMPELPVEVSLPDTRLSQIKGWRVPDFRLLAQIIINMYNNQNYFSVIYEFNCFRNNKNNSFINIPFSIV